MRVCFSCPTCIRWKPLSFPRCVYAYDCMGVHIIGLCSPYSTKHTHCHNLILTAGAKYTSTHYSSHALVFVARDMSRFSGRFPFGVFSCDVLGFKFKSVRFVFAEPVRFCSQSISCKLHNPINSNRSEIKICLVINVIGSVCVCRHHCSGSSVFA